ncbi:Hypothetical_protein [Hexamita inflata]|uniref:Hypothetical_protein n=1 Tax=Hexamita inflata TaxID=28002 RepID=A0AA86NQD2_9EUKA|nr:Hypothetical protein HINF_LOCUS11422 [Hexamita inflata]
MHSQSGLTVILLFYFNNIILRLVRFSSLLVLYCYYVITNLKNDISVCTNNKKLLKPVIKESQTTIIGLPGGREITDRQTTYRPVKKFLARPVTFPLHIKNIRRKKLNFWTVHLASFVLDEIYLFSI